MTVDFDGVMIGGTVQARAVAATAVRQGARIALVEPVGAVESQMRRQLTIQVLAQVSRSRPQASALEVSSPPTVGDWARLRQRVAAATDIAYPDLGLDTLAMGGVDAVVESAQFSLKPCLAVTTATRRLRGRRYLLSPPTGVMIPAIPGLAETPVLTPETLLDLPLPPPELVILGRSPDAIALAQSLAMLGIPVTLLTRAEQLLPTEDRDISAYVESLLMASGVNVQLGARLTSVAYAGHFTVQFTDGDRLKAPHLLLATARHPQVESLHLKRINVQTSRTHIPVDDRLKTTRPGCFAFGPCLGGYWADHTDTQDGQIAIHNALYLPWRQIQQLNRVGEITTTPEFARFGMTAHQARWAYGNAAQVIQVPFEQVLKTQLDDRIGGFCRCIMHHDGRILGAQLVGPSASDLAQTLALLAQGRPSRQPFAPSALVPLTTMDMVHRLGEAWQARQWQPGTWRRDWAENWFNWRRSHPRP